MSRGLSIVVCAYDRPALLRETFESLRRLDVPADINVEIVAIISPHQEATWAAADGVSAGNGIPILRFRIDQLGLSRARNRGLAEAHFDHVAYFDDDVEVARDWIAGYFEAMDSMKADCVVGPVSPIYEAPPPDYLTERVLSTLLSPYSQRGDRMIQLPADVAHEIPGCDFGVRRQVALDVGGFDPRYGRAGPVNTGGDDFEFGLRLVAAGRSVVYQPRCAIGHKITAEKFAKPWFRGRWRGGGAAQRFTDLSKGMRFTPARRARGYLGIVRTALAVAGLRIAGRKAESFELELQVCTALGYFHGPR